MLAKLAPNSQLSNALTLRGLTICAALALSACGNAEPIQSTQTNAEVTQSASVLDKGSLATIAASLQSNLKKSGIEAKINQVSPTAMPTLYWVNAEGMPGFYTDKSGQYVIQGEVVKVGKPEPLDVSAKLRQKQATELLAAVKKQDMVIFSPQGKTKAVVYAFTDADCGYCRKLHSEMDDINAAGIEVRYLAWPRSPQTTPIMENIWCSSDRQAAMTAAKQGKTVKSPSCSNPVESQQELGLKLGVRGTPALFTTKGEQIGGYVPVNQLKSILGL